MTEEAYKKCPFCAEQIPGAAIRCSRCQADLKSEVRKSLEKGVGCFVTFLVLYLLYKIFV